MYADALSVTQYGPSVTAFVDVPHAPLAAVTATETTLDVLVAYVLSPAYTAVKLAVCALLKVVASVASPPLSVLVPSCVVPL